MIKVSLLFLFICLNSYVEMKKIVGGYRCKIEEYPFMVNIRHTGNFKKQHCGGTLLSDQWILTAAHCCKSGIYNFTAVVGFSIVDIDNTPSENKRLIVEMVVHDSPVYNDICLAKMQSPITTNKKVQFVKLPSNSDIDKDIPDICKTGIVAGWGKQIPIHPEDRVSEDPHLQCVELETLDKKSCAKRHPFPIASTEMCTYTLDKDACLGDSGGPFICKGLQYGVVSGGKGCADNRHAGVYVRVDMYLDFIREHITKGKKLARKHSKKALPSNGSCKQLYQLSYKRLVILISLLYVTLKIK